MSEETIDEEKGEVVSEMSIDLKRLDAMPTDVLVDLYQAQLEAERSAKSARIQLAVAIANRAPMDGECRTTRVRGERYRVRVEWPEQGWDQRMLKQVWLEYPDFREQYLDIATIRPRLKEIRKLENEHGSDEFEHFRNAILDARRRSYSTPRIEIE